MYNGRKESALIMIVNPAEKEERRKVSMASGNKKSAKENREENTKQDETDTNSKPKKYIDLTLETVTKKTTPKTTKKNNTRQNLDKIEIPQPKHKQQTKQVTNQTIQNTNKDKQPNKDKNSDSNETIYRDNNKTIHKDSDKNSGTPENLNNDNNKTPDKNSDKNLSNKKNSDKDSDNNSDNEKNHLTAADTPKPKRGSKRALIQHEDKLQIVQYYEDGMDTDQIAEMYGISKPYVYRILSDPAMKEVRAAKREAVTNSVFEVMEAHAATIESITTKYLELANDDARIAKTSLGGLFTVFGIIIDKQLKLEELRLKREELELRREEAKKPVKNDTGLLADFLEVIKNETN